MTKSTRKVNVSIVQKEESVMRTKKDLICSIVKKKTKQKFLSESQKEYYQKLTENQI